MNSPQPRKIGIVALATALALVLVAGWFVFPHRSEDVSEPVPTETETPVSRPAPVPTDASDFPDRAPAVSPPTNTPQPEPPAAAVDLVERARQVEDEANRRLAQLTNRFGLTEAQQSLIFPALAHSSKAYDPGLSVEGETESPAKPLPSDLQSVEERIYDSLDPVQQAQLQVEQVERDLWWKNVLTQIDASVNEEN